LAASIWVIPRLIRHRTNESLVIFGLLLKHALEIGGRFLDVDAANVGDHRQCNRLGGVFLEKAFGVVVVGNPFDRFAITWSLHSNLDYSCLTRV